MKPLQELMKKDKPVLILLLGLLLLIIALPVKKPQEKDGERAEKEIIQQTGPQNWQTGMEEKLKTVLEQVKGVGRTEVFLTCKSSGKKVVEKDETDTVYEKDAKGNQLPYVASEEYPEVAGVLVVAEGGDNPIVVRNIQEAVVALFQVEAHKIKVMKMN